MAAQQAQQAAQRASQSAMQQAQQSAARNAQYGIDSARRHATAVRTGYRPRSVVGRVVAGIFQLVGLVVALAIFSAVGYVAYLVLTSR
jgi:hypothetical protein